MLIRFSVENFMSFKQQQIFSMAAGKGSRHPSHVVLANNNRLLKSSFIFGANAAGKSNFIHAVDFMRRIVISGDAKRGTSRDKYFRIDPEFIKRLLNNTFFQTLTMQLSEHPVFAHNEMIC